MKRLTDDEARALAWVERDYGYAKVIPPGPRLDRLRRELDIPPPTPLVQTAPSYYGPEWTEIFALAGHWPIHLAGPSLPRT